MNILISGGTGLVGTALGKALAAKGHRLFVLTRNPEGSKIFSPYPHTPIYWDATKNAPPSDLMAKMDGVINMAGVGIGDQRWNASYKRLLFNSRVVGTQNLVRAANEHGKNLKFFLSTSAVGYYEGNSGQVLTEESQASQSFLGKLCVAWESPVVNMLNDNVRKVILRIGVVLSESGGALEKMLPPIRDGYGGALGSGRQVMPWIDIDDLVNMFVDATESDWDGVYNAVAPSMVTNQELTQEIANRLNRNPGPKVPGFALKIAVGEFAKTLVESQQVSCEKIEKAGFKFQFPQLKDSIEKRVFVVEPGEKVQIFQQWIPKEKSEIFPFFAEAKNLAKITPPHLNFKIESMSTEQIQKDTVITYKIGLHGIPMSWVTKITIWDPPSRFADNQESGPYKKWLHVHEFEDLAGGTLMTDTVRSKVPMGRFGLLAAGWKVYSDVKGIFEHRQQVIAKTFGNAEAPELSPET